MAHERIPQQGWAEDAWWICVRDYDSIGGHEYAIWHALPFPSHQIKTGCGRVFNTPAAPPLRYAELPSEHKDACAICRFVYPEHLQLDDERTK